MKNEFSPERLSITGFARDNGQVQEVRPLSDFPRLASQSLQVSADAPAPQVSYHVAAEMRPDAAGVLEPWLHLQAQAVFRMVCQRCLGEVDEHVGFDRSFRFVATEALAEIEDEESQEDVLVVSSQFNLLELVEDELLMAMPLVPRHAECPQPVRMHVEDPGFAEALPEKPNPFAVLGKMKGGAG